MLALDRSLDVLLPAFGLDFFRYFPHLLIVEAGVEAHVGHRLLSSCTFDFVPLAHFLEATLLKLFQNVCRL
jgi:hypothetical protein